MKPEHKLDLAIKVQFTRKRGKIICQMKNKQKKSKHPETEIKFKCLVGTLYCGRNKLGITQRYVTGLF